MSAEDFWICHVCVCVFFFFAGWPKQARGGLTFCLLFCVLQVTSSSAAWEASRTPGQIARRTELKADRSRRHHALGAVMQPTGSDAPTREDRACPSCRGHAAYKCQRDPPHCQRCCARADRQGPCPYHQQVETDMRAIALARQAEAAAAARPGPRPWGA
jgi:hypothetical protein